MSDQENPTSVDMIRWTFSVETEKREEIETHLVDLGLDVVVLGESQFHVIFDEPDHDTDELAAELWDLNGEPFEITQEEFHRLSHILIHADETDEAQAA